MCIYVYMSEVSLGHCSSRAISFLLRGFWGLNLGPQACVASTTVTEPSTQLSEVIASVVGQQYKLRSNRNIKLHYYLFKNVWHPPTHTPSTYTCSFIDAEE